MRDIYASKAISQIPRLLSLEDRIPFSPTYGCCNREFWLCRAVDFPNSIMQFGIHALALAWKHEMPGNIYYQHPKIAEWTVAAMDYWMKIQHRDGSFDEFYPNERGWAGPTGFLLYSMIDSYRLLGEAFPEKLKPQFFDACERAAKYLIKWDESGVLANHHAMAVLPVFETARLLNTRELWVGYEKKLAEFYTYCNPEGWCLEYDGADPGYLSATVSFLGKIYKHRAEVALVRDDKRMREVMTRAVDFCAWFAYPNGHYAGTIGSRQTLHFYPHGFEILAPEYPMAAAVADHLLKGLNEGALVPPEIQSDRYYQYRIPELLLSYVDYGQRPAQIPTLPWQTEPLEKYYPNGRFLMRTTPQSYTVVNAAKGGIIKHFDLNSNKLIFNDCGILAELEDGRVITSQWIDPQYAVERRPDYVAIRGTTHRVATKIFTPLKFIAFRLFMLAIGWNSKLAYEMKGLIRRLLMTQAKPMPVRFARQIQWNGNELLVTDLLEINETRVRRLLIGDEMPVRYVPQSRYFQPQELDVSGWTAPPEAIEKLNRNGKLTVRRRVKTSTPAAIETEFE
ncbi:hypothetical protein LLG95_07995 [bacterium]|nr:hypothetical protein [bacterium]